MVFQISHEKRTGFPLNVDIKLWCRLAETQTQGHLRALGSLGPVPSEQVLRCTMELQAGVPRSVGVLNLPQETSVQLCTPKHHALCAVPWQKIK